MNPIIESPVKFTATICILAILLTAIIGSCVSCSTNTGDPAKDQRARVTNAVATEASTVAWDFLLSSGENYLKGKSGQDTAGAIFAAAKDTAVSYDASAGIARIRAAAGPQVANAVGAAIVTANPKTPEQTKAAFNSVGAAFQSVANANANK